MGNNILGVLFFSFIISYNFLKKLQVLKLQMNIRTIIFSGLIGAITHICQDDAAHLSCPFGQRIGIVDAFYGRDDTVK